MKTWFKQSLSKTDEILFNIGTVIGIYWQLQHVCVLSPVYRFNPTSTSLQHFSHLCAFFYLLLIYVCDHFFHVAYRILRTGDVGSRAFFWGTGPPVRGGHGSFVGVRAPSPRPHSCVRACFRH